MGSDSGAVRVWHDSVFGHSREMPVEDLLVYVFSRLIGAGSGGRAFTRSVSVALAGLRAVAEADTARGQQVIPAHGWPDGRTVMRRIDTRPAQLDRMWHHELAQHGANARLPTPMLAAFFPAPAWSAAELSIRVGPIVSADLLERFVRSEALRQLNGTRARPSGGTVSSGTLEQTLAGGRRFFRTVSWYARRGTRFTGAGAWQALPPLARATDLGAIPACTDRSSPPIPLVQDALQCLDHTARTSSGHELTLTMRNRFLLGLVAATGARIGAVAHLRVSDYDPRHTFPDGSAGPAVALRPGKTLPPEHIRWKALPDELAAWLEEHITHAGLTEHSPLFPRANNPNAHDSMSPSSLTKILSGSGGRRPLFPRTDNPAHGYSAHTLRHLAARLALASVHHGLCTDDPTVPPHAYLASLLDHHNHHDPHGYLDTTSEAARETLSRHIIHANWQILRGHHHAAALRQLATHLTTTQLRATRRALLEADPTASSDPARFRRLLHTTHYLTALIDDATNTPPPRQPCQLR